MNDHISLAAGVFAFVLLPIWYVAVCVWLFRTRAWWFDYLAYFVLFGSLGGWCFAIAWGPGGIAALSSVFLYTAAALGCVVCSVVLTFRKKKSRAEWIALAGGYLYPCLLAVMLAGFYIAERSSK